MARLQDKLRKEERELSKNQAEYDARKQQEWVGLGESVLGFFIGRKSTTRAVSGAMGKRRQTGRAWEEIEESQAEIEDIKEEIAKIEAELKEASNEITRRWGESLENLTTEELVPRRTDITVEMVGLAWQPSWLITYTDGRRAKITTIPAFTVKPAA